MNRSTSLLVVAVLVLVGILVLLFLAGPLGGVAAPPVGSSETEAAQPSPLEQLGGGEGIQEGPGPTERKLLENPAPPVAADPAPTLLEGYVRSSSGEGIPGVRVDLIVGRAATEKDLYSHRRLLEQRYQKRPLRRRAKAHGMTVLDGRKPSNLASSGGFGVGIGFR